MQAISIVNDHEVLGLVNSNVANDSVVIVIRDSLTPDGQQRVNVADELMALRGNCKRRVQRASLATTSALTTIALVDRIFGWARSQRR